MNRTNTILLITLFFSLLMFSTVQAQQVPPPIQLRVYIPCQIGITFGATQLIAPHGVNRTIGMALANEPVQPYNYQETYVNQPTPSLTIMWWTNSSGTWLLGFYVNYTAVVDQWLTYYAFGQDSQGNQMGTTFEPMHVMGQSVALQFQVVTLLAPRPPTLQEAYGFLTSPDSPSARQNAVISGQLADIYTIATVAVAISALAALIGLMNAYTSWRRRR